MASGPEAGGVTLAHALYALSQDATHARKQVLEGESPDLHTLGRAWKILEQVIIEGERRKG